MTSDFTDNPNLIFHLKNGNEAAYAYLVETYNHWLCVYANSLLNNTSIAEDVVQNVFVKVWENRNSLKPTHSIKGFLYRSVYNGCINAYKKNRSVTVLERKYIEELDRIVEERDTEVLEKLTRLVKLAIEELPPKCKEIFLLSKKEGLTNIEISEYLGISKNTIERQINIAFSKIRESVGNKTDMILFLLFGCKHPGNPVLRGMARS